MQEKEKKKKKKKTLKLINKYVELMAFHSSLLTQLQYTLIFSLGVTLGVV